MARQAKNPESRKNVVYVKILRDDALEAFLAIKQSRRQSGTIAMNQILEEYLIDRKYIRKAKTL